MDNDTAKSMINYRFFLEQSRIKKELETGLRPINDLLKKNRITGDLVVNNYHAAFRNCAVQMIKARLEVEKDVRQRIGIGIDDDEIQQLSDFVLSMIDIQEKSLYDRLKTLKVPLLTDMDISFDSLRGKVSEIVSLFCQELDFDEVRPIMNVQKPSVKQYNISQLVFNINHNLNTTADRTLAKTLHNLTQAVKNLDLNAERLTESLELIEGLTEQAKLQPEERRRGIINGCLQRLKTVIEESGNVGLGGQIMQTATMVAITFDCAIDMTVLM